MEPGELVNQNMACCHLQTEHQECLAEVDKLKDTGRNKFDR